ncbi:MAG: T9SS type A sorting domain-containing protein [Crocinitomicaceae bacterium]|jgi:hypothetical protein|nr:T9SS type A sorting domain-containing protein [Crocinitomicaceae bacterium]MBT5403433.1 T9SS type A sorting domain-containing protein [Crocinitomicaceae bacterium]MBT6028894.1 T9SS type A sorting domain-containing protein [Crocinitomicaceae bacterium]MBT6515528.1 T9SS type A sorting domain-containing protein [Crocinitomicaceae bacterium]
MKYLVSTLLILSVIQAVHSQNNVCFTIETNPTSAPGFGVFTKYVDVFGCGIYAESSVSDEKVLHAAAVWAELIDNDENGIVDDPAILNELLLHEAMMPVFESDGNAAMNTFFTNYTGDGVSAVLWQSEIDPSQTGHWGADATVEEILHTINHVGHTNVYSSAFDLTPNSSLLSEAMDTARGGQWLSIPSPYPTNAWYHYDDFSCDYECMAIEYMYWMIVTNMGILDDAATCAGIANEWEPCSPALLQSMDLLGYGLITDSTYKLPQNAPDGNYCPTGLIIKEQKNNLITVFPNPANNTITITRSAPSVQTLWIKNSVGQIVKTIKLINSSEQININGLKSGVYFFDLNQTKKKLIVN